MLLQVAAIVTPSCHFIDRTTFVLLHFSNSCYHHDCSYLGVLLCNTDTSMGARIAYPIRIGYRYVSDTPRTHILGVSDFSLFLRILDTLADTF